MDEKEREVERLRATIAHLNNSKYDSLFMNEEGKRVRFSTDKLAFIRDEIADSVDWHFNNHKKWSKYFNIILDSNKSPEQIFNYLENKLNNEQNVSVYLTKKQILKDMELNLEPGRKETKKQRQARLNREKKAKDKAYWEAKEQANKWIREEAVYKAKEAAEAKRQARIQMNEHAKANGVIYDIVSSNSSVFDARFTDAQGRRVYFHEDGTPYVYDARGRRTTRFKGAAEWTPFVDNMSSATYRPKSNMFTYHFKALDAKGNVIDTLQFESEVFDILDYKERPLPKGVQGEMRKNAFDYVLAKQIIRAQKEMNKRAEAQMIEINKSRAFLREYGILLEGTNARESFELYQHEYNFTFDELLEHKERVAKGVQYPMGFQIETRVDDRLITRHETNRGDVRLVQALKANQYRMPTVFNPAGIRWTDWSLPEVLQDEALARFHRASPDGSKHFLSIRGLGQLKSGKETLFDVNAIQQAFGMKHGTYRIYEGEQNKKKYQRLVFSNNPEMYYGDNEFHETITFKEGVSEEYRAQLVRQEREKKRQKWLEEERQKAKLEFLQRQAEEGPKEPEPLKPLIGHERRVAEDQALRVLMNDNPTYDAVRQNLKEFEELFIAAPVAEELPDGTRIPGYTGLTYSKETLEEVLIFDRTKLHRLYNDENQPEFYIDPEKELEPVEKQRMTLDKLKELEQTDPERYSNILQTTDSTDDAIFKNFRYAKKHLKLEDNRKPEQKAFDDAHDQKQTDFYEKIATKDIDSYNLRRLDVTHDILEHFGGYESYQRADRAYTSTELRFALDNGEVQMQPGKGYFIEMDDGTRNYLHQTHNYNAEPVWALLRSGSLHKDLEKNVHMYEDPETKITYTYDVVTLEDLEHDRIRLASEQEKNLFVLTSIGEQKAEETQKIIMKVRQHNEVINELIEATRAARNEKRQDAIELTKHLQEILGVQKETVSATEAYIHVSHYFDGAFDKGLTEVRFDEGGIRNGRAFDNLRGYLYTARGERHPIWDEVKKWNSNRSDVQNERNFLLKEFNVDTDAPMASRVVTSEEMRKDYQERLHLDALYEEGNKSSVAYDEMQEALERMKTGKANTGDSGRRAKRDILDRIVQSRYENVLIGTKVNPETGESTPVFKNGLDYEQDIRLAVRAVVDNVEAGKPITRPTFHALRLGRMKEEARLLAETEQPKGPVTWTKESLSHDYSNRLYDEILESINRDRATVNLPELTAFDVQSVIGRVEVPKEIQQWKDTQAYAEQNDAFYRRKGSYSLYTLKDVLSDGTVIGERLAAPAEAFNIKLTFDNPNQTRSRKEVGEELTKATNAMIAESDKIAQLKLSPDEIKELNELRTAYVSTLRNSKSVNRILNSDSIFEMMLDRSQVERYQPDGKRFDKFVNKRLMDIVASRASWMLRKDNRDDLASTIWMGFSEAMKENPEFTITTKNGIETFNQEFEDAFTKHLHRSYFAFKAGLSPNEASESLVHEVADFAKRYVKHDPTLDAKTNHNRLAAEVHRLIMMESGDLIKNQYDHYEAVLDPTFVSETILRGKGAGTPLSLSDNGYLENKGKRGHQADDFEVEDETERVTSQQTVEERRHEALSREIYDEQGRTIETIEDNVRYINERDIKKHESRMRTIRQHADLIAQGKELSEKEESRLRDMLGDKHVEDMIATAKSGAAKGVSDWDLFKAYFDHTLEPTYGGDGAYELVQQLARREQDVNVAVYEKGPDGKMQRTIQRGTVNAAPLLGNAFWQGVHKEILTPTITTPDRLRSYVQLVESIPSLNMTATLNRDVLFAMMPDKSVLGLLEGKHELSDIIPENDSFELFIGQNGKGDLLARSKMTNLVLNIAGTDHEGNIQRPVDVWSSFIEAPSRDGYVAKHPTMDGVHVASPADTLPIAINPTYNATRINRSPNGVGSMDSSDVSTRSALEMIVKGTETVGMDFETTGFLNSGFLRERGLVLPTEVFYEQGQYKDGQFTLGEREHVFLNVGEQLDNRGIRVHDIVTKEMANIAPEAMIQEVLGSNAKPWAQLSQREQLEVMKSDKVSFLRNLAKYSPDLSEASLANVTNFDYVPSSFTDAYTSLVNHAERGLNNIAAGTVKAGATYVDSLEEFMNIYNEKTDGRVFVAQNGANADIPWARHFAQQSGVDINEKPMMVEMMHISRLLNPEARSHSLESQIARSGIKGLYDEYKSGNHLADIDTHSMMRLFSEEYLPKAIEMGLHEQEWMRPGQYLVRLGSTGSNKLPHDMYQVGTQTKFDLKKDGGYSLSLKDITGQTEVATIDTPSLQELQQNISKNYKAFDSLVEAQMFLDDLTFDDAREDVSGAMLSYDNMVREQNRVAGNGVDVGMQNLRAEYDAINKAIESGQHTVDDLNLMGQKIVQNSGIVNDEKMAKYGTPDYSVRQRRAMAETADFFASEDAELRKEFLGEVDNLRAAGVIDDTRSADMIRDYNERIKRRAAEIGRGPLEKEVPGLVDLGFVQGEKFVGTQGKRLTAMVNTYDQAERSLWEAAKVFKPLTDPQAQKDGKWLGEAIQHLGRHLEQVGIMQPKPIDPKNPNTSIRMEDIVDAVLTHHENNGNMKVADITQPLIQGPDDDEMRAIFKEVHNEVLAAPMEQMSHRPDQQSTYDETKAMRELINEKGFAAYGFDYKVGGTYEGLHLKTTGDFAFRHADDLMEEINELNKMTVDVPEVKEHIKTRTEDLWREIYSRATDKGRWNEEQQQQVFYSDKEAAQHHLGWDNTPNQYVHPSTTTHYPVGTKYYDMEERHIRGLLGGTKRDEIRDRVQDYLNQAFGDNGVTPTFTHINPSKRGTTPEFLETLTHEAPEPDPEQFNHYVEEPDWHRPIGGNRPLAEIETFIDDAFEGTDNVRKKMADILPSKKAVGIVAAGAAAAYLVSQWTRGDSITPESRPQHDQAPDTSGNHQPSQSTSPQASQPPMQNKTYMQENGGLNINIQARNRTGVQQPQIDNAISQGLGANVTVHHQDDTSSISNSWLQEKFAQLLDNGFVN